MLCKNYLNGVPPSEEVVSRGLKVTDSVTRKAGQRPLQLEEAVSPESLGISWSGKRATVARTANKKERNKDEFGDRAKG